MLLSTPRYGDEIARLRSADASLKEGLAAVRRGVSSAVIDDMKVCGEFQA
jgi:hypothetical protein